MTDEQKELCYEVQFALMRGIMKMNLETMWDLIQKAIEKVNDD